MNYYVWKPTVKSENEAMLYGVPVEMDSIRGLGVRFDYGEEISAQIPPITLVQNEESQGRLNDNLVAPGTTGLVLSSRLRDALTSVGVDTIDYYPLQIQNPRDNSFTDNYFLANITAIYPCVDFSASDVTLDPTDKNHIQFIESLVLGEPRIPSGAKLFRLKEHHQVIVVSKEVKEACEAVGITGVDFVKPEDFHL